MNKNKIGGIASLVEAVLYILGFVFIFSMLKPMVDGSLQEQDRLVFVLENKILIQIWNLLIYVVFGLVLIPLTIAIKEQFQNSNYYGLNVISVLGFIWSGLVIASGMVANVGLSSVEAVFNEHAEQALIVWKTIEIIQNGIGGGVEVVGGFWVLLISGLGFKQQVFSKGLNSVGLVVGLAGVLTAIPGLQELGAVFGLTQIVWFIWLGVVFLKAE